MNYIEAIFNLLRNKKRLILLGVERDLMRLIQDRDISQVISLLQDIDIDVNEAIAEYNPEFHKVNSAQISRVKAKNLIEQKSYLGQDKGISMK